MIKRFTLKNGLLILALFLVSYLAGAQSVIKGQVISEDGEAIPGATVLIEGGTTGSITDLDGNYTIQAAADDVLVFSFVGFESLRMPVNSQSRIDVTMTIDIAELSEVVVMGYSEKSRRELTASATTIGEKDLKNVTSSNIESMLQGKVAGVSVTTSSGSPGEPAEIRIRGVNSLTADRAPLVVVDGIIGGTYQPNDVASVTVLKDAAATSLYGSLASGGVLIVTTKQGNGDPVIEFSTSVGVKEITTGNFSMMNGADLYDLQEIMWGDERVNFLKVRPEDLKDRDFNWLDESFKRGVLQNYYLAARGGTEKMTYAVSGDYYQEDGTLLETGYERMSLRTNLNFQLKENVSLKTNLSLISSERNQDFWDWRYDPFLYLPWDSPYSDDGSIKYIDNTTSEEWYGRDSKNVLHSAQYNYNNSKGLDFSGNAFLNIDLTDWLSIESRNRVSISNGRYESFLDPRTREGKASKGSISTSTAASKDAISTLILRGEKSFGKHSIGGFVGAEGNYYYYEDLGASARNIPIGLNVIGAASEPVSIYGNNVTGTRLSYLSEMSYSYGGKYFVTGVFRADASSKFGPESRWGYFPGASASWIVSSEDFFVYNNVISFLKLRASYGEVGNDNVGSNSFPYLSYYDLSDQYNGIPAATIPLLANNNITWETLISRNIGVDLTFFNRINATFDYYNNTTTDLLLDVQLPLSTGFEIQARNVGEIRNQGVEAAISADIFKGNGINWTSSYNVAFNKSENLKFADTDQLLFGTDVNQISAVGEELRQWYLPKWLGVDPANGDPLWEKVNRDASGEVVSREATSNYNEAEFQRVGSVLPKLYGGWTNSVSYKGFSLSVLLSYQYGNQVYHSARQLFDNDGAYTEYNMMELQDGWSRWEKPGDDATHPLPKRGGNKLSNAPSSRYLEDGSYIRLRNVSLTYNFPQAVCKALKLQGLNLGLSGDNLYTWTKFSGLDPEARISVAAFELPGFQDFKYPISRQYLMKLTARF
ncbi:MAG: TonB-dependent receptor [Marinoscillum sp.]|uniref:SusC/RagA family TonB-linked outer membrane protein n=1 Tax=Marinoscillum sp. TaxID=2024838 RepID=UPI0032FC462D